MSAPPVQGPPHEHKIAPRSHGSFCSICTAALKELPEEEWPGSKELMEAFVKKTAAVNQVDLSTVDVPKLALKLRTNTGALVTFNKKPK